MSNFYGTDGNDIANSALGEISGFTGSILEELVDGLSDTFLCGAGEDFVFAGSAGDLIQGGDGFDRLKGAEGDDIIYANLQANPSGSLIGDEILGNLGDDRIFGSAGGDRLEGGPGGDELRGEGGDDILLGEDGFDTLTGGAGRDEVYGSGGSSDVLFFFAGDVVAGEIIDGGRIRTGANDFRTATVTNCPRIEMAFGGTAVFTAAQVLANMNVAFGVIDAGPGSVQIMMGATAVAEFIAVAIGDVRVIGDSSDEVMTTVSGYDLLGFGGDDRLTGGGLLSGGTGNDILEGNAGDDIIIGGDGIDSMSWFKAFDDLPIVFTLEEGGEGTTLDMDWLGFDVFSGIENIISGNASDFLTGNSVANALDGSGGDDQLAGAGGNDILRGGVGDDTLIGGIGGDNINGGTGSDTASYAGSNAAVQVNLGAGTAAGGHAAGDVLEGIENLSGSEFNDTLAGNGGANVLDGAIGADAMAGGLGNDTFIVDASGDTVTELAGAGSGFDTARTALASYTLSANVEKLIFTDTGAHTGKGNASNNALNGNAGADRFLADAGGNDVFSGGNGSDSMDFRASLAGAAINLLTSVHGGAAAGDIFASMEKFFGSNTAADAMTAGAGRASFSGFGGNDTLTGGANIDVLSGGDGNDTLSGGGGVDTLQGGKDADMLTGGAGRDYFVYVETAASGGWGADTVTDWQDGLDIIKIDAPGVASSIADFTIAGNGTASVLLTLNALPSSTITLHGAAPITITAVDFVFY